MTDLTVLGQTVRHALDATGLETFPVPQGVVEVTFRTEEFVSVCPITAQPDLSTVTIRYEPTRVCLESKSLKLYLWGYREQGIFAETIAAQIAEDVRAALDASWVEVLVEQRARGGITTSIRARR